MGCDNSDPAFSQISPSQPLVIDFGSKDKWDSIYLDREGLGAAPGARVKLEAISYKVEPRGWLCGI